MINNSSSWRENRGASGEAGFAGGAGVAGGELLYDGDRDISFLQKIFTHFNCSDIELAIISGEQMRELNARTRGKDYATDVLSFPHDASFLGENLLGCIAINADLAAAEAAARGHSEQAEIALLFIHGALHLLGYDHEHDAGEHRAEEARLVEFFGLPKSLIDRNS